MLAIVDITHYMGLLQYQPPIFSQFTAKSAISVALFLCNIAYLFQILHMGRNGALAGSLLLLTAGIVPLGLGCAPICPQMVQLTPSHFDTEHTQSLMDLQMACAYIGSLPLPSLLTSLPLPHVLQLHAQSWHEHLSRRAGRQHKTFRLLTLHRGLQQKKRAIENGRAGGTFMEVWPRPPRLVSVVCSNHLGQ